MSTLHTPIQAESNIALASTTRHPLRVAVVTETYPPEINGVAATLSRVVEGLLQRGHHVDLVRPRQGPLDAAGQGPGLHEQLLPGLPIPRYPQLRMGLPATGTLVRQWRARRPDVVHLVTEGPLGWSALRAAQALQIPTVSDFRTHFGAYSRHYGLAWLHRPVQAYLRRFHNRTATTMVPTETLRSELQAQGFERLRVVARGVDTQLFNPLRRSAALRSAWGLQDEHARVVLYVGRLAAEKNLGTLVQAFELMQRVDPRLRLVLVGDGPERGTLQQRCPQALFAGQQRGPELAEHYASADLFLFPSLTETFGNVVPEAMASGLAVVAFDCAAAGQLVRHGHNGLLARVGDEAGFCATAARLAGAPGPARALGAEARAAALQLDWGRIALEVEAEYRRAIARAPQPRLAGLSARPV